MIKKGQKQCPKCRKWKPKEKFYKDKSNTDSLSTHCKICRRENRIKYLQENREEVRAYIRAYYKKNRQKALAHARTYKKKHPERVKACQKRWKDSHKEEIKARQKVYYYAHREKSRIRDKIRREKGKINFQEHWRTLKPSGTYLSLGRMKVRFGGKYTFTMARARWNMMKHLNRYLESWENVHHKNENPLDDRIENLEIRPHIGEDHVRKVMTQLENKNEKLRCENENLKKEIIFLKMKGGKENEY